MKTDTVRLTPAEQVLVNDVVDRFPRDDEGKRIVTVNRVARLMIRAGAAKVAEDFARAAHEHDSRRATRLDDEGETK